MESFFSRQKVDLIYLEKYKTMQDGRADIFEYIKIFHNRRRRHSTLGQISPLAFEQRFKQITMPSFRG